MNTVVKTMLLLAALCMAGSAGSDDLGGVDFKTCEPCHQTRASSANGLGLQGNDIFEPVAVSISELVVWTAKTPDPFIANLWVRVSDTSPNFTGFADQRERGDLPDNLHRVSDDRKHIPEAEPTAQAGDLDPAILALQGDVEYGEYLAGGCTTCHQSDGANDGIPDITGWEINDFVIVMHAYKRKLRPHPVMQMMAARLSDEEIASIAAYFKDLK